MYEQLTGSIQYQPPGFLGKDKRTGERLYQFVHPKSGDKIIISQQQYNKMTDRVNTFIKINDLYRPLKKKGFLMKWNFRLVVIKEKLMSMCLLSLMGQKM